MTVLSTLMGARALLSDPAKWTQGSLARTTKGSMTHTWNEAATCWCLQGALERASNSAADLYDTISVLESRNNLGIWIPEWNDEPERGYSDVVNLLDKAIQKEIELLKDSGKALRFPSLSIAMFNQHINNATEKALAACRRHFPADNLAMQALEDAIASKSIMSIFDHSPTPPARMFAYCVFILVNDLADEVKL